MGTTRDALESWKNEFQPDGEAKIEHRVIHGVPVDTLDVNGTKKGLLGGLDRPNFLRLVAVARGPRGRLVVFLNGPRSLMSSRRQEVERLLLSIRRE
jgi:hypothetical protein